MGKLRKTLVTGMGFEGTPPRGLFLMNFTKFTFHTGHTAKLLTSNYKCV